MGINLQHAYSVLDTVVLRENSRMPESNITVRLIYVRNPWAVESYNGTYSSIDDFNGD